MVRKILVTGDYWHREFKAFLAGLESATLIPINKLDAELDANFDLIVIAQSHPDQILPATVEKLQFQFVNVPMVVILGSWCEGEQRTGQPWPGVFRIYWHQWQGRYEMFVNQMERSGISSWHAARTSTTADHILSSQRPILPRPHRIQCVGVSAWTEIQFEMMRDAIKHFGWQCRWVERSIWDAESAAVCNPICVDADSLSLDLERRLVWLKSEFPKSSFVLVMNFPRIDETARLAEMGIAQVVSKPFELNDLRVAIESAMQEKTRTQIDSGLKSMHE